MLVLVGTLLSAVVIVAYYWFRASSSNPVATSPTTVNSGQTTPKPPRRERSIVNYSKLEEYLQKKNWRAADIETYERLLEAAGPTAMAYGQTPQSEMDTLSCADFRTVDALWSKASDGKFGFTAQQQILRAQGSWQKMYNEVGWRTLSGSWLIQWNTKVRPNKTYRLDYKPGKEPNFTDNAPIGHLPTVQRGYNFEVSLDQALLDCAHISHP